MKKLKNYMSLGLLSVIAISSCGNKAGDKDKGKTDAEKVQNAIAATLAGKDGGSFKNLSSEEQAKAAEQVFSLLQKPEFYQNAWKSAKLEGEPRTFMEMSAEEKGKVLKESIKFIEKQAAVENKEPITFLSECFVDGGTDNLIAQEQLKEKFSGQVVPSTPQGGQVTPKTQPQGSKQLRQKSKTQQAPAQQGAQPQAVPQQGRQQAPAQQGAQQEENAGNHQP